MIYALIVGIITSVIGGFLYDLLKSKSSWLPGLELKNFDSEMIHTIKNQDIRAQNRAKVNLYFFNLIFYILSFFILYLSYRIPLMFKGGFFNEKVVYLNSAKFIGSYLPSIPIGKDIFQLPFIVSVLVMYIPTLYVTNLLVRPIIKILNKFYLPTIYLLRRVQLILFTLFSLLQAGVVIYLFFDKSLKESLILPFVIFGIVLILFFSDQEKK